MVKKAEECAWRVVVCSILIIPLIILAGFSGVFFDHGANSVYARQEWGVEEQAIADETFAFLNFQEANLSAYNEREISHLEDVKARFKTMYLAGTVIFLILILLILTTKQRRVLVQNMLFYGGLGTLGLIILLAILSLFDFSGFWIQFHYIIFPNGNWAFPEGSTLIQLFPEKFFYNFAVSVILAVGSYGLVASFIGFVWKRRF